MIGSYISWRIPTRESLAKGCQSALDATLVVGLLLTLLALGGRHDGGRLIYVMSVGIAAGLTVVRAALLGRPLWSPKIPLTLAIAGIACVAVQLAPLPEAALRILAPGHESLLPMWGQDAWLGDWSSVSLTPAETVEGLGLILAHTLLFFVVGQRVREEGDIERVLFWIGVVTIVAAAIGALQRMFPDERLLWCYDYPSRSFATSVQGTFANRNHFAHLLIFGAASLVPFAFATRLQGEERRARKNRPAANRTARISATLGVLFILVVALATQSRGGVAALVVAGFVAISLLWWGGRLGLTEVLALAAVGAVVLSGVSLFGYEKVTARLDDLVSGDLDELDADARRRQIWMANTRAFMANPWLGHGAGSHRYVYPAYIDSASSKEFTHAESGYFQIASENGVAGLVVIAASLAFCVVTVVGGAGKARSPSRVLLWSSLGAGLTASFVHSIVDFVWYVPILCGVAVVFAACAKRLREIQASEQLGDAPPTAERAGREPHARFGWGLGGVAVAGGAFSVACLTGPALGSLDWDHYLRSSKTIATLEAKFFRALPADVDPHLEETIEGVTRRSVESLDSLLAHDPLNARAHSRIAGRLLQQFEREVLAGPNPLSLDMISGAVASSGFRSGGEVRAWLQKAFGDSSKLLDRAERHAEAAVRLCPLQGEAYLQLASLGFLEPGKVDLALCVGQAVRVRPFDGRVRFEAGRQVHLAGDAEAAFDHYRASVRLPGSHRQRLIALLSRVMSAATMVEVLKPDCTTTELMLSAYKSLGVEEDLVAIAEHAESESRLEEESASPREAARRWRQVSIVNRSLKRYEQAIACATRAYELTPNDFWVRHELAMAYYESEAYPEADPHLRWCLARRPDFRYLQRALHEAAKKRAELALAQRIRPTDLLAPTSDPKASVEDSKGLPDTQVR